MLTSVVNFPRSFVDSTISYITSASKNANFNNCLNHWLNNNSSKGSAQNLSFSWRKSLDRSLGRIFGRDLDQALSQDLQPCCDHTTALITHPWFYPAEPPVIVAFGEWIQLRSLQALVQAFAQVRSGQPAHLILLGDLPQSKSVEAMIEQYQMQQWIALPGNVNNAIDYLNQADISVIANNYGRRIQRYSVKINSNALHAAACQLNPTQSDLVLYSSSQPRSVGHGKQVITAKAPNSLASAITAALEHPSLNQSRHQRLAILNQIGLIQ